MPDDLMRAKHAEFGVADVPDNDFYRESGWTQVDESTPTAQEAASAEEAAQFHARVVSSRPADAPMQHGDDPADFKVEQVVSYLDSGLDDAERVRVLDAERAGRARKTLLDY